MKDSWDGAEDPLAALRAGRSGPFEAFVTSETGTFLRYFARLGASRSEAEDLAQETFLKLFRSSAQIAQSTDAAYDARGQFRGYAFRVARNVWIDRVRRGSSDRRTAPEPVEGEADPGPADARAERPDESAMRDEASQRIRRAVAALPESHRVVFELAVIEELPYAEIAESLDIPVGTVKSRMHTAVGRVRRALEEKDRVQEAIRTRASARRGPSR